LFGSTGILFCASGKQKCLHICVHKHNNKLKNVKHKYKMKPTLLVLAAGIGSRYGGLKQVDGLGPGGHAILEYSIYDAIRAGFGKVVFVIRRDIEDLFKEKIGNRVAGHISVEYAFQEIGTGLEFLGDQVLTRVKPWGTGHAILSAQHLLTEPFAVINADDFYDTEAYAVIADFLRNDCKPDQYGMVGYKIMNTLSENGSVSRGVCSVNADGNLDEVVERTKIYRDSDQSIVFEDASGVHGLADQTPVSMNFWGFHPDMLDVCATMFKTFIQNELDNPKAEFFIPLVVNEQIQSKNAAVKVITTDSAWFGVTYTNDKEIVQSALFDLVANGQYPEQLWA
jgi:Nucleotidyl transferase